MQIKQRFLVIKQNWRRQNNTENQTYSGPEHIWKSPNRFGAAV